MNTNIEISQISNHFSFQFKKKRENKKSMKIRL